MDYTFLETNRRYVINKTINTTSFIQYIMKFNFFGKKSKCLKCGKKFKNASELRDHERAAHTSTA